MNTIRSIRICDNNVVHIRRDTGTRTYTVHDYRRTTLLRAITAQNFSTRRDFGGMEFWRY